MSKRFIYPGSFDVFTNAHLYVTQKAFKVAKGDLWIVVATNTIKSQAWFTNSERVAMIEVVFNRLGLPVGVIGVPDRFIPEFAQEVGAEFVIRGLRDGTDYSAETKLMRMYRSMNPNIDPLYIPTFPDNNEDLLSSSLVKSLVGPKGWEHEVKKYLPSPIDWEFIARARTLFKL